MTNPHQIEKRAVSDLREHPEQPYLVGDISEGELAKAVVQEYVRPRQNAEHDGDRVVPHAVYRRLVDCLHEGLEILPQHVESVAGVIHGAEGVVDVLERSQALLASLREAEIACRDGAFDHFDQDEDAD